MLNRVITPSKSEVKANQLMTPLRVKQRAKHDKRTKEEFCILWKLAIHQTIVQIRIEKENERQNALEQKRVKLDYNEIVQTDHKTIERWNEFIAINLLTQKCDPVAVLQSVRDGVPRTIRGDVWKFLADQYTMEDIPIDINKFPNYNAPYDVLLKNLTEHQHSIFIDLGRTFPNHDYYKSPLGIGQLSLFNILKAYSILDPEVGYCQGLAFICGVLLLHVSLLLIAK